jgi:26S proteasome regulatory subunit T4
MDGSSDPERQQALEDYKKCLLESREWEAKLKSLRLGIKDLQKEFDTTEENIKALQSVGQIIGEVLKQLDEERCKCLAACFCFWLPRTTRLTANSYRQSLLRS